MEAKGAKEAREAKEANEAKEGCTMGSLAIVAVILGWGPWEGLNVLTRLCLFRDLSQSVFS